MSGIPSLAESQSWIEAWSQDASLRFRRRTQHMDWAFQQTLQIDRIQKTRDFLALHNLTPLLMLSYVSEEELAAQKPYEVLHLLRLNQLVMEYQTNLNQYLFDEMEKVELVAVEHVDKSEKLLARNKELDAKVVSLEAEVSALKELQQKQSNESSTLQLKAVVVPPTAQHITPLSAASVLHPCSLCTSVFVSVQALQKHKKNKHFVNTPQKPTADTPQKPALAPPEVSVNNQQQNVFQDRSYLPAEVDAELDDLLGGPTTLQTPQKNNQSSRNTPSVEQRMSTLLKRALNEVGPMPPSAKKGSSSLDKDDIDNEFVQRHTTPIKYRQGAPVPFSAPHNTSKRYTYGAVDNRFQHVVNNEHHLEKSVFDEKQPSPQHNTSEDEYVNGEDDREYEEAMKNAILLEKKQQREKAEHEEKEDQKLRELKEKQQEQQHYRDEQLKEQQRDQQRREQQQKREQEHQEELLQQLREQERAESAKKEQERNTSSPNASPKPQMRTQVNPMGNATSPKSVPQTKYSAETSPQTGVTVPVLVAAASPVVPMRPHSGSMSSQTGKDAHPAVPQRPATPRKEDQQASLQKKDSVEVIPPRPMTPRKENVEVPVPHPVTPRRNSAVVPPRPVTPRRDSIVVPPRPVTPRKDSVDVPPRPITPRRDSIDVPPRPITPRRDSIVVPPRPMTPRRDSIDVPPRPMTPRRDSIDVPPRPITPRGIASNGESGPKIPSRPSTPRQSVSVGPVIPMLNSVPSSNDSYVNIPSNASSTPTNSIPSVYQFHADSKLKLQFQLLNFAEKSLVHLTLHSGTSSLVHRGSTEVQPGSGHILFTTSVDLPLHFDSDPFIQVKLFQNNTHFASSVFKQSSLALFNKEMTEYHLQGKNAVGSFEYDMVSPKMVKVGVLQRVRAVPYSAHEMRSTLEQQPVVRVQSVIEKQKSQQLQQQQPQQPQQHQQQQPQQPQQQPQQPINAAQQQPIIQHNPIITPTNTVTSTNSTTPHIAKKPPIPDKKNKIIQVDTDDTVSNAPSMPPTPPRQPPVVKSNKPVSPSTIAEEPMLPPTITFSTRTMSVEESNSECEETLSSSPIPTSHHQMKTPRVPPSPGRRLREGDTYVRGSPVITPVLTPQPSSHDSRSDAQNRIQSILKGKHTVEDENIDIDFDSFIVSAKEPVKPTEMKNQQPRVQETQTFEMPVLHKDLSFGFSEDGDTLVTTPPAASTANMNNNASQNTRVTTPDIANTSSTNNSNDDNIYNNNNDKNNDSLQRLPMFLEQVPSFTQPTVSMATRPGSATKSKPMIPSKPADFLEKASEEEFYQQRMLPLPPAQDSDAMSHTESITSDYNAGLFAQPLQHANVIKSQNYVTSPADSIPEYFDDFDESDVEK